MRLLNCLPLPLAHPTYVILCCFVGVGVEGLSLHRLLPFLLPVPRLVAPVEEEARTQQPVTMLQSKEDFCIYFLSHQLLEANFVKLRGFPFLKKKKNKC